MIMWIRSQNNSWILLYSNDGLNRQNLRRYPNARDTLWSDSELFWWSLSRHRPTGSSGGAEGIQMMSTAGNRASIVACSTGWLSRGPTASEMSEWIRGWGLFNSADTERAIYDERSSAGAGLFTGCGKRNYLSTWCL